MSFFRLALGGRTRVASMLLQQRFVSQHLPPSSAWVCVQRQRKQQQQQGWRKTKVALASAAVTFCLGGGAGRREVKLGDIQDFPEGGIYEVAVNEGKDKVLLAHVGGSFYCTGSSCPHYGAPLVKGVVTPTHVTCPWHNAKFDIKTGKCTDGPNSQGIATYQVTVKGSSVYASLPERLDHEGAVLACCSQKTETAFKDKTFVIVGGGPAASAAAEELRAQGFQGRLIIISKEDLPPYDRIMLSKNLKCEPTNILLRPMEFIRETLKADLRLGERVVSIDADGQRVKTDKGNVIAYDKLLLCTGSDVRQLDGVKGSDASGVFYLRTMADLEKMRQSLFSDVNSPESLHHVVLGSSFIGIEIAAALKKVGVKNICVVGKESVPFERVLGRRVGGAFKDLLAANGVEFVPKTEASEIITRGGKVTGVKLSNGRVLAADRVVVGIGALPEIPQINSSKHIKQGARGGLSVDPFLKTPTHPTLFVAGDIASFPYVKSGEELRIEHYATAMDQGRVAATNMLEMKKPFTAIPFFWTVAFGKGLRYIGDGAGFEDVIIEGDLAKMQFVAYYTKGDKVVAAATMGMDPVAVAIGEAMQANIMPTATELRLGLQNSQDILNRLKKLCIQKVA